MIWFRITLLCLMGTVFTWTLGESTGILIMITKGVDLQDMAQDPAKNGTLPVYVFILMFLFYLMVICLFGFIICYLIWKNRFQMDHKLRHYFIIWVGCWVGGIFSNMGIAIYALVRNKDPQGQMGFMYEMFQKYANDGKFIASYERFQRENNCCGIYGPDDWLMVQLRSNQGGMSAMQSMDYGFQQNPSSGKCHLIPPTIPPGCGRKMMMIIISVLNLYAALSMVLIVIAAATGIMAWYCFFYWLDKEVIVIPEDEVSNIIIVEPDTSETDSRYSNNQSGYFPTSGSRYLNRGDYMGHSRSRYLPPGSYIRHGNSIFPASIRSVDNRSRAATRQTVVYTRPSNPSGHTHYNGEHSRHNQNQSRFSQNYPRGSYIHSTVHSTVTRYPTNASHHVERNEHYLNPSATHNGHVGSYLGPPKNHASQRVHDPNHHETTLERQEHFLGGKLLGEMHVDHQLDEGKDNTSQRPQGQGSKHQAHHATLAIVRNKHAHDPKPVPMQGHGHTGRLAEDIAEMSGRNAVPKLDDVIIPVNDHHHHHPERENTKSAVLSLGSVTGGKAQNALEDMMLPEHLKKNKSKEKKTHPEQNDLIHPHYLPGMTPPGSSHQPGSNMQHDHPHDHYLGAGHPHDHHENHGTHHGSVIHDHNHHPSVPFLGPPRDFPSPGGSGLHHSHRPSQQHHEDHHLHHDEHYLHHDNHSHHEDHHLHHDDHYLHHENHSHHEDHHLHHDDHYLHHENHHENHSHHAQHINPSLGSHVRRDGRSRSHERNRHSENATVIFRNPHELDDSD